MTGNISDWQYLSAWGVVLSVVILSLAVDVALVWLLVELFNSIKKWANDTCEKRPK